MKRYLLFYGDFYYPAGGWKDFKGDFDTREEADAAFREAKAQWGDVVDTNDGTAIELRSP